MPSFFRYEKRSASKLRKSPQSNLSSTLRRQEALPTCLMPNRLLKFQSEDSLCQSISRRDSYLRLNLPITLITMSDSSKEQLVAANPIRGRSRE